MSLWKTSAAAGSSSTPTEPLGSLLQTKLNKLHRFRAVTKITALFVLHETVPNTVRGFNKRAADYVLFVACREYKLRVCAYIVRRRLFYLVVALVILWCLMICFTLVALAGVSQRDALPSHIAAPTRFEPHEIGRAHV